MKNQKVVLVVGSADDKVIRFFASHINHHDQSPFYFIDQSLFGEGIDVCQNQWRLASGRILAHHQVVGVWNRLVSLSDEHRSVQRAIEQYVCYLMDEVYPNVLNRPKHGMSNHSKQYQIDCISTKRLKKVDGYICANSELDWGLQRLILIRKSLCGIRSVVQIMSQKEKSLRIETPELFQPYVHGLNIRVHVVNEHVVACCCRSKSVDYRYAEQVVIQRFSLPRWLEKECVEISQQLQLPFAGIDLIKKGREYFLLEVNPAPGYAYFDIDKNISIALLNYYLSLV